MGQRALPRVLLGAGGLTYPGTCPRPGRWGLHLQVQQTCCLRRRKCGKRWVEGPKWPLHFAAGRDWKSHSRPLVSQVKRLSRRSHGILMPALGLAGHTAHLGNEPGRGRGSLPG